MSPLPPTPIDVVTRFYDAENAYMNAGGARGGVDFAMAATLDLAVVLHQTPDLPWGGEFHGHAGTRSRKTGHTLDLPMAQMVRVSGDKIVEFRPFYWNVPAYQAAGSI